MNKTSVDFTIPLINDTDTEDNAPILVTLRADQGIGTSYTVGNSRFDTVYVIDDDSLPVVTIMADNGVVVESDAIANFMLSATGLLNDATLDINVTPTEDGSDFLTDAVAGTAADFSVSFTDPDSDGTFSGEVVNTRLIMMRLGSQLVESRRHLIMTQIQQNLIDLDQLLKERKRFWTMMLQKCR